MSTLLEVKDITKIYPNQPKPGLDHVSFEVMQGEFLGIMGASGSGKTTLLKKHAGAVLFTVKETQKSTWQPTSRGVKIFPISWKARISETTASFRKCSIASMTAFSNASMVPTEPGTCCCYSLMSGLGSLIL